MPIESPINSSPKSNHARKNSRESAAQTAGDAFASKPAIPNPGASGTSASQAGQRRLSGAFLISLDRIEADPFQPRKKVDSQHIVELSSSIAKLGVLQPISVRFVEEVNRYRIIAGECRYQAAKQAGLAEIPCWVRTPEQKQILLEQVVENWQRSDLSAMDLAESLGILRDANGYTQVELTEITGKSKGEISRILSLLELDPEVQQLARQDVTGLVSRRHLYAMRDFPVSRQIKLISGIQDGRYTAESIEVLAKNSGQKATSTGRLTNWQRRTFKTRHATVSFQFRKPEVNGHDVIEALREIKRQVGEDGVV